MRDVIAIETKRLKLRGLQHSDAAAIARYCGDPGVGRNLAMTPLPYLESAAEGWIMIVRARAPAGRDFVFGVELAGEGLIGCIGAHQVSGVRRQVSEEMAIADTRHLTPDACFEVGYWLGRPFWGQGFATEVLQAFVAEAQALGALEAGHFVDNPASGRVLAKGGFAYTGEVKPMFSLARGERVACKRMRFDLALDGGLALRQAQGDASGVRSEKTASC